MYSWPPNLSQILLKNSFGKVVFQILAEIKMSRNENRLFGRHFETVDIFYIFFPEIWLWLVYIYGVKIITKFGWESGFLKVGSMETPPPLCTNGSAGYLMQLSVNIVNSVCFPKVLGLISVFFTFAFESFNFLSGVGVGVGGRQWNCTLYRGLWRAASLSLGQPPPPDILKSLATLLDFLI